MPRKTRGGARRKPGAMESVTENKPPAAFLERGKSRVRVKRRGKSPPPGAQAPGHDKPHAVQDITGSTGRLPAARERGSFRVLVASALREGRGGSLRRAERNDHHPRRATAAGQNSAYRQPSGKALSARRAPSLFSIPRRGGKIWSAVGSVSATPLSDGGRRRWWPDAACPARNPLPKAAWR